MKIKNIGAAVAFGGAAVNLTLFLVKLYVAVSCNSLSIYLDSFNNAIDSLVCVGVGLGFILSKKGATENYPFGFGRTEGVVNFSVSVIILITGLSFAYSSLGRIIYPLPIWYSSRYALMILLTVPVKILLLAFYRRANKKVGSPVLDSLALDSKLDFFITLCSFAALTFSSQFGFSVDGIAGMIMSVILVAQGIKIVKEAFGSLLGRRDVITCALIKAEISERFEGVLSVDSVQCHIYGDKKIANITVRAENADLTQDLLRDIEKSVVPVFADEVYIRTGG
jgi:cation diffusion facilitator family transporter